MKQYKLPGRQSQAYNILSLIAISGELPKEQVYRLPGGGEYKRIKVIPSLKEKKFISTYYNDKLRGYRLTSNSKNELLADNRERFEFYLTGSIETNQPKYEIRRRLRLKSIAEAFVTMQNAGVAVYKDEKPDIFYPEAELKQTLSVTAPAFYNSREMKNYGIDFNKVRGSRSVGALLTQSKIFVVYNTGGSVMKWDFRAEVRTRTLLGVILGIERLPCQYRNSDVCGLMLGDSMEQFYQLLTNKSRLKERGFKLDNTYDNFLYLPNDSNGEMVLRLLCDDGKTQELNRILSLDFNECNPGMLVDNDAVDQNGNPVLFAYDCNMTRIVRFSGGLEIHDMKGTIYCFDFQADVLRRYCCNNVIFETIKTDKFKRRFYP